MSSRAYCWLVVACGVLGSCKAQPGGPPPAASSAATTAASTAADAPTSSAAATAVPSVSSIPQGNATGAFSVVAAPTAKDVPKSPLTGSANGHVFDVKRVEIIATASEWWLTLVGPSRTPTVRWDHDSEYARVRFGYVEDGTRAYESSALGQRIFRKRLGQSDPSITLSFNVANPADPTSTLSHTGDGALYLEFTSWKVKPWNNEQKHQIAGVASGKLYMALAGGASVAASGLLGEFKDVPISRTLLQPRPSH